MTLWYLAVFAASLVCDLLPFIGPPAWTVMVFFLMRYDLNPWLVLMVGVPASTVGRYLLTLYIPRLSEHVMTRRKNDELKLLGKKLSQKLWRAWTFILGYTLLPVPTTPLFTAAGIAHVTPLTVLPPFFVGKLISDAFMVFTGRYAAANAGDILHGTFSPKTIIGTLVGLIVLVLFLFVDWFSVFLKHRLAFKFHIWK